MDDRMRLVRKVSGVTEFRISFQDAAEMGQDGMANVLMAQGFGPDQCGRPKKTSRGWAIPVRTETDE